MKHAKPDKTLNRAIFVGVFGILLCIFILIALKTKDAQENGDAASDPVSQTVTSHSPSDADPTESASNISSVSSDKDASEQSKPQSEPQPAPDVTPPEFSGLGSVTVEVGDTVSYRSGVKAKDDVDGELSFTVDSSGVDLSKPGEYKAVYICVDSAGNKTEKTRKIIVTEKAVADHETVLKMVTELKNKIVKSNMSKPKQLKAVYDWVRNNNTYVSADEITPDDAVYRMIKKKNGDCYNYCWLTKMLLDECGFETIVVSRFHENATSSHFWLLVNIGTGWYHLDSSPHLVTNRYNCFMQTDAQIYAYNATRSDKPWYYSFDESLYPERETKEYSTEEAERILSE